MKDYLIVGFGLAGLAFSEMLRRHQKSFEIISDTSQQASIVAGGLYNPVILKRFTLAWEADEQLKVALPFYNELEQELAEHFDIPQKILRRFAHAGEHNLWHEAAEKKRLAPFLENQFKENTNSKINADFKLGQVKQGGRVKTKKLLEAYKQLLTTQGHFRHETFVYQNLNCQDTVIDYDGQRFKKVVFCEGYGLKNNPFFNYLPLTGTKGELLTIHAPELKEHSVIKSSVFIIPLGNDYYRVGATYKWNDKTSTPTIEAKNEIISKLDTFLNTHYQLVGHVAGIRPTVTDRRPLVGRHPKCHNFYVLNGFGSRGVLIAPWAAQQLYHYIENDVPMHSEMNIERFVNKYPPDSIK